MIEKNNYKKNKKELKVGKIRQKKTELRTIRLLRVRQVGIERNVIEASLSKLPAVLSQLDYGLVAFLTMNHAFTNETMLLHARDVPFSLTYYRSRDKPKRKKENGNAVCFATDIEDRVNGKSYECSFEKG